MSNSFGLPVAAFVSLCAVLSGGCAQTSSSALAQGTTEAPRPQQQKAPDASPELPLVTVYKNRSCGCCGKWVEHMKRSGFPVEVHDLDNLDAVKTEAGIPAGLGSCHTAKVGGYFIEGHVPAEDVKRLLAQKPAAKGLTVPGMPAGSPGMEVPDGRVQPYDVQLVAADGSTSVFAHHE